VAGPAESSASIESETAAVPRITAVGMARQEASDTAAVAIAAILSQRSRTAAGAAC
jgi:hypothetical protein